MPRPPKPPTRRRGYVIHVYVTEDEFAEITDFCEETGVSASYYLRDAALRKIREEESE